MEAPGRLGAGIGITISLAALSLHLLAHPLPLPPPPPAGVPASDPRITQILLELAGAHSPGAAERHLMAAFVGALGVGAAYALFRRVGVDRSAALWLTVAFAFGTAHWWAAAVGDALGLAQVLAVLMTLLALTVALTGRWPLLAGLLLGLGAAARLPVALAVPLLVALYLARPPGVVTARPDDADGQRRWLITAGPVLAGVLLPPILLGGFGDGFGPAHPVRHLEIALLRPFDVVAEPPWLRPSWMGLSLLLTSPFLLWLARARSRATAVRWGWVSAGLVRLAVLASSSVGDPQYGYRPILDLAPVLFLVLCFPFRDGMTPAARLAVAAAVAVNAYGMIVVGILEPPFAAY